MLKDKGNWEIRNTCPNPDCDWSEDLCFPTSSSICLKCGADRPWKQVKMRWETHGEKVVLWKPSTWFTNKHTLVKWQSTIPNKGTFQKREYERDY